MLINHMDNNALHALEHTLNVTLSYIHSIRLTGINSAYRIGTRAHKLANWSTMPATTCTNDHNSIRRVQCHASMKPSTMQHHHIHTFSTRCGSYMQRIGHTQLSRSSVHAGMGGLRIAHALPPAVSYTAHSYTVVT